MDEMQACISSNSGLSGLLHCLVGKLLKIVYICVCVEEPYYYSRQSVTVKMHRMD